MITSRDKLMVMSSFKEELIKKPYPKMSCNYIDMMTSNDVEHLRLLKMKNRELTIDILLGEKDESELENRDISSQCNLSEVLDNPYNGTSLPTVYAQVMSLSMVSQKFTNYEDLYYHFIQFLDKLTKNPKVDKDLPANLFQFSPTNDSGKTSSENEQYNTRKLITKIINLSSVISMQGRIGPGTSVVMGKNVIQKYPSISDLFQDGKFTMDVIIDNTINPDKIIVCRGGSSEYPGIILNTFPNDNIFFLKETFNWDKQYCWFTV